MRLVNFIHILIAFTLVSCHFNRPDEEDIMVLYTTEIFGNFLPWNFYNDTTRDASLANFASLVKEQRSIYGDRCIVLDGGNAFSRGLANLYYNYIDSVSEPACYRAQRLIGYDAVALGYSELRLLEPFYNLRHDTLHSPPVICANIINRRTGHPYFRPWVCIERRGIRIAVFSLVDEKADNWTPQLPHPDLQCLEMVDCMRNNIMRLRRECKPDVVIALVSSERDIDLQKQIPGIDFVIDTKMNGVLPKTHAGMIRIHLTHNKETDTYSKRFITVTADLSQYEIDEDYRREFYFDILKIRKKFKEQHGSLPDRIITSYGIYSPHDYYRDLLNQAQLWYSNADMSFSNIVNPNRIIESGEVDMHKIFDLFNHENCLVKMWLKGEEIHKILEYCSAIQFRTIHNPTDPLIALRKDAKGHPMWDIQGHPYLRVPPIYYTSAYGINYEMDLSQEEFHRITITGFQNGKVYRPEAIYSVVTNSFLANQPEIRKLLNWNEGETFRRLLLANMPMMIFVVYKFFIDCEDAYTPSPQRNCTIKPENIWRQAKQLEYDNLKPTW